MRKPTQSGCTTGTRTYGDAGQLLRENYSGGPLNGLTVTNRYDAWLRRATNGLWNGSTWLAQTRYGYDDASRLRMVASGTNTVAYSYLADSPLVGDIWFTNGSTLRMTTTKSYDFLNRLTNIVSSGTGFQSVSFAYAHNSANQRTAITNADDSKWVYTYDSLGQVISGKKYWSDGTPVAGQHFEYAFDDIGNRQSTKAGGDNSGARLRPASYLNNALNQIVSREVSSYVNVLGSAHSNATVTLWGDNGSYSMTSRKGEYFRGELYAKNATGAVWLTITNVAVLNNGANPDMVTNVTGKVLLAKTPETFSYDADGNLTRDGLWTNVWNAENRLLKTENLASVPAAARAREEWTYLPDGRWIQRIVSTNNGSSYYPAYTNRYVWDGQVLLAILDHTNGLVMSFMRGLDLSGSLQGAGGVGGVLAVNFKTNGAHFCAYDGNGNVAALVSAANGSASARYEYGPFGETIRMTGPVAKLNPIRFSTHYADDVTGDVKYLFRDYRSDTGRWPSRDPLLEKGGVNVYGFISNDGVNRHDLLGQKQKCCHCGEDVTLLMTQTELDVKEAFKSAPYHQKVAACASMFSPMGLFSWEINWLVGYRSPLNKGLACNCQGTVTYAGRCVHTRDLNYVFFGWAMQLCNQDSDTLDVLWAALWWRARVWREDDYSIQRKVTAAEYGYTGDGSLLDAIEWPSACLPSQEKGKANTRRWTWLGLRSK